MTNAIEQFRAAMGAAGLNPPDVIISDGKFHRFSTNGNPKDDAGWYMLFEDGCGGVFGDFRTDGRENWQAERTIPLTPAEREAFKIRCEREHKKRNAEQKRRHETAAKEATAILARATGDPYSHTYAVKKSVPLGLSIKRGAWPQRGWDDALLIALQDSTGKVWSVEAINIDGSKDYLHGGKKQSCFYSFGDLSGAKLVLIGEGVATVAAAVHATGLPGVAAMDCGNLQPVAISIKQLAPNTELLLLADNDIKPDGSNPGLQAATAAAKAVTGRLAVPELAGRTCDFWDLLKEGGKEAVASTIAAAKVPVDDPQSIPKTNSVESADPIQAVIDESGLGSLKAGANMASVEEKVRKLSQLAAGFDDLRFCLLREAAMQKLSAIGINAPGRIIDAGLKREKKKDIEQDCILFIEPEPWPAEIEGAELLDEIVNVIRRYLMLSTPSAHATALWVLHTWALEAFDISPLLAIVSAMKRSGKTTLLELVGMLVPRSLSASNITPAALFRAIEKFKPVLLIDEADTFLGGNEELRGILNASHRRSSAFVIRTVGDTHEPKRFRTWGAKAIALIGKLPGTLEDRSIPIEMRRRTIGEAVDRFRSRSVEEICQNLRSKAVRWASDATPLLCSMESDIPPELNDRAADNWRPLLTIADYCSGTWPTRAREAAKALSADADEAEGSALVELLQEISEFFESKDRITSSELAEHLAKQVDKRWADWRNGKPITPQQIAKLLSPLKIKPMTIRIGNETAKGYLREAFSDAFSRYLPGAARHTVTAKQNQSFTPESDPSQQGDVTDQRIALTARKLIDVSGVTDRHPEFLEDESLREDFEERAAIQEYDGCLSREQAEHAAKILSMRNGTR